MSTPTLFLTWRGQSANVAPEDLAPLRATLAALDGVVGALAHLRAELGPDNPFAKDGAGPVLTLELAFANEAVLARALPMLEVPLAGAFDAQAMRGRRFPTPEPEGAKPPCTLLVEYTGRCDDPQGWLDHYDAHHPAIMTRFPGVRDVATYRPAPDLPIPQGAAPAQAMQRNKVVFDSPAALMFALRSPVIREMRADYDAFPPFDGFATHFPTRTLDLLTRFAATL